jgi:hypothetical protein
MESRFVIGLLLLKTFGRTGVRALGLRPVFPALHREAARREKEEWSAGAVRDAKLA